MNTSAASFGDLEGMLRSAVEQIVSPPPPTEVAERILERAAKWEAPSVRTPAKIGTRLYLAAGAALTLVLLLAVAIAMVGGLPREKSVAVVPKVDKTEPKVNPPDALRAIPPPLESAASGGVAPPPSEASPEKRLGAQAFGGMRTGGVGLAAGANPSRWFSVAGEATILVSTGGKEPIRLGEKQAFTSEAILHVWDWSKSDKSRPLDASCPSFSVSPDGKWIVTNEGQKIEIATGKVTKLPDLESQPPRIAARKVWTRALFSRDGRRLALLLSGENQTATFRILELENGKKLCDIENQWPAMLPATFAPSGSEILLMGKDNFVRRFDAATGKELQKYEPAHQNSVRAMIVSPSGKLLVSGGSRGDLLLWDVAAGKLLHKLVVEPAVYADAGVYSLAFSPDETQVAGGGIGSLLLWSVETGQAKKFPRGSAGAEHIRFSADGRSVTIVHGFSGTSGPAGEHLLVYPSVSKWDVAEAK